VTYYTEISKDMQLYIISLARHHQNIVLSINFLQC